MDEYDDILEVEAFRTLNVECPYCGHVQDIDELCIGKPTDCVNCEQFFRPVEA